MIAASRPETWRGADHPKAPSTGLPCRAMVVARSNWNRGRTSFRNRLDEFARNTRPSARSGICAEKFCQCEVPHIARPLTTLH
jgi:hypothetical protein